MQLQYYLVTFLCHCFSCPFLVGKQSVALLGSLMSLDRPHGSSMLAYGGRRRWMDGMKDGVSLPFLQQNPDTLFCTVNLRHIWQVNWRNRNCLGSGDKDVGQRWETLRTQKCWFLFQFIHLQKSPEKTALSGVSFFFFSPSCTHHICCISVTGNRHRIVNACSKPKLKCNPLHLVNSPFLLESK